MDAIVRCVEEGGALVEALPATGVHPDLLWADSGAMALCGAADAAPRLAPAPLATAADAAVRALARLSGCEAIAALDGAALLGERAALFGLSRRGRIAPGGSCRLVRAGDGWLAVNLARPEDVACLPAWLEVGPDAARDAWARVESGVRDRSVASLVERARWLGLPIAASADPKRRVRAWCRVAARGEARAPRGAAPRVLDLSSLWAGPLCTQLLLCTGAQVWKLESAERPDGARRGAPAFFDLLHAGKRSALLDLRSGAGRAALRRAIDAVDVVVESARPRALQQLGIDAEACVRERPGLTWVSLTGYGRRDPEGGWVAFGDDAAAAAGLCRAAGDVFCGDAIADPLAGVHAAVAAWAAHRSGGGQLLDVSLEGVVAHLLGLASDAGSARVVDAGAGHEVRCGDASARVRAPRARRAAGRARPLGADTVALRAELRC